ncbi:MAG TPA: hypothetical protein VF548_03905 [Allosphingosinicella sp.]|jgi:hypothetical protein
MRNAEDAKSRESRCLEPQLQRLENPLSINALNALRDGASCSDTMGCGGYVGLWGVGVKGRGLANGAPASHMVGMNGTENLPSSQPRPLVYLDTQDYSRFGDVLRGKSDNEHERIFQRLLELKAAGAVTFVYSMPILGELLQFDENFAETTEYKARAVEQLCGEHALVYPGRLVALEAAEMLHREAPDRPEPLVTAYNNRNYWYPNVSDVFEGLKIRMQSQLMGELGTLPFTGRALRRRIKAHAKKLDLAKVAREAAPDMAEEYGLPVAAVTQSIVGVLEGRVSTDEASHNLFGAIARPTSFVDVYFRRFEGEKTLPRWMRGAGENLQKLFEELKAKVAPYLDDPSHRKFLQTEIQGRRRSLGAGALLLAQNDLQEFSIPPYVFQELRIDVDRAAKVPACFNVGTLLAAYAVQITGVQGHASIERSFGGDLIHALYAPHVALWRGDRRFSHLFRSVLPELGERVVSRLSELPEAIDRIMHT